MNFFAQVMLYAWIPISMAIFCRMAPHRAVLVVVIGGWLFLPMASGFNIPGIPEYTKMTAIALGLLFGGGLSRRLHGASFRWSLYDVPMIVFCLSTIPSSLTNGLGLYNGLSGVFDTVITWGVPYYAGRLHFNTPEKIKDLCVGLVMGGMIYVPLALLEARFSPRLSIIVYGFFPHEWQQHRRYGGWRPIVFMQHGLMVALWFAATTTAAFWLWKSRIVTHIRNVPMGWIVLALAVSTVLARSANGLIGLVIGCGSYFMYKRSRANRAFQLLLLIIPLYPILRVFGLIETGVLAAAASSIFDQERVASLSIRLLQEDLFVERAMHRLTYGWGGISQAWPVSASTGRALVNMIDSSWLIIFSVRGIFGLSAWLAAMLIGPWLAFREFTRSSVPDARERVMVTVLGLIVVIFMIDSLVNGMVNPVYILSSGSLVSLYLVPRSVPEFLPDGATAYM